MFIQKGKAMARVALQDHIYTASKSEARDSCGNSLAVVYGFRQSGASDRWKNLIGL